MLTIAQIAARVGASKRTVLKRKKVAAERGTALEDELGSGVRKRKGTVTVPCAHCGKQKTKPRSYLRGSSYCNRICRAAAQRTLVERKCAVCGSAFKARPSSVSNGKARFDSKECAVKWARMNPSGERQVHIAGVSFSLRELATASGLSKGTIATRLAKGMAPEHAIAPFRYATGPKKRTAEQKAG